MSDKPSVRWIANGPMETNLRSLFNNGEIEDDEPASRVYTKYIHLWPGLSKDNFRRHFNKIKKDYFNYDLPSPKPKHATDRTKGKIHHL